MSSTVPPPVASSSAPVPPSPSTSGPSSQLFSSTYGLTHISSAMTFGQSQSPSIQGSEILNHHSHSHNVPTESPCDEVPTLASLLYHRPSLTFYREEDDDDAGSSSCASVHNASLDPFDGVYPPPPHTTISGPPSSIGLCNGRPGDHKNIGNLCALEYINGAPCCFYCNRDLH